MSRRPPMTVNLAAVLLVAMGAAGLAYAILTVVVAPRVAGRVEAAGGSAGGVVQTVAVAGVVLAAVVFAVHLTAGLLLRRGWNVLRIVVWVFCLLGVLAGVVALVLVPVGDRTPGTLGAVVQQAYPEWWIPVNIAVLVAQIVGYLAVGTLLLAGSRGFFAPAPAPLPGPVPAYVYPPSPARPEDDQYWSRPSS